MKILSGQIHEYIGNLENVGGITLGYLEQIHFMDESKTVRDELRDAFQEIREIENLIKKEEEIMVES